MREVPEDRQRGLSLAIALSTIGDAMQNAINRKAGRAYVVDHYGTVESNRFLHKMIEQIVNRLGIIGINYRVTPREITIWYDVDQWIAERDKRYGYQAQLLEEMPSFIKKEKSFMDQLKEIK